MRTGATLRTALLYMLSFTTGGHDSELDPHSSCSLLRSWSMLLKISWLDVAESLEGSLTSAMLCALFDRSATHLLAFSRTMLTFIQESVTHETIIQSSSIHGKGLWQTFSFCAGQHHTVLMPYWELCDLHYIELLRFQLSLHLTTEAEVPI